MKPILSVMLYLNGDINQIRTLSDAAVDNGITNIYFPDHLLGGRDTTQTSKNPWLAMVPTLIDIAKRHKNIKVGPLVASPSLRPSAQLALEASTISHIIGNDRFILSVGAGGAKSDQLFTNENLNKEELSTRFENYIKELNEYRDNSKTPNLRLASEFKIRIASDSASTINTVSEYGDAWVTTGGWKSSLDDRIKTIQELSETLAKNNFKNETAVCASSDDGLTLRSNTKEIQDYASLYNCKIDEIIIPLSSKNI